MYLYWWIQQDLNCLGEIIQFHDPALINSYRKWFRKNFERIVTAEDLLPAFDSSVVSLN